MEIVRPSIRHDRRSIDALDALDDTVGHHQALSELRARLSGTVLVPGDDGYRAAASIWNDARQGRPRAVARCGNAADVATALRVALGHGCPVAVRGGGYGPRGSAGRDGALVIDTRAMAGVAVDVDRRTVTVGAGTTWGELDAATTPHGYVVPGPPVAGIGVIGSTLSGGHGQLRRRYGLAADSLIAASIVLADGSLVRVSGDENSDLLWGLRGGGGNFGVVTEMTFHLSPLPPTIVAGAFFVTAADSAQLLHFYRDYADGLPDDVTSSFALMGEQHSMLVTHMVGLLPSVRVASILVACTAETEVAQRRVDPIRRAAPPLLDTIASYPYAALQGGSAAGYPAGWNNSVDTAYVDALDPVLESVLMARYAAMPRGGCEIKVDHMGAAIAEIPPMSTAVPHRRAPWLIQVLTRWPSGSTGDAQQEWLSATMLALEPFRSGGPHPGMVSGEIPSDTVYGPAHLARLRALKTRFDPQNVFTANQNVAPYA